MSARNWFYASTSSAKHNEMVAVYKACTAAKVSLPSEVKEYFKEGFCEEGVKISLSNIITQDKWDSKTIIPLNKLPKNTTHIIVERG